MTLHVTNGDGAGGALEMAGLGGDVLPWRDLMHHGPFPPVLSLEELAPVRAAYLAGNRLDPAAVTANFRDRDACLRRAVTTGEPIVLWFEHDLLDQLQLLQILDAVAEWRGDPECLSLICLDAFPGISPFRGLGQLMPEHLAGLFPSRLPVSGETVRQARQAWAIFRGSDPRILRTLADRGVEGLAYLGAALARHCAEFPWTIDGLTLTERRILTLVGDGLSSPGPLFRASMDMETVLFPGDWTFFDRVASLCAEADPLLAVEGGGAFLRPEGEDGPSEAFRVQRLALTDRGRDVLSGRVGKRWPRDEWLGGIRVNTGDVHWCWDGTLDRFVAMAAV
ncbi:MAG: hypothetical protein K9H25_01895 [Rhodospirillum sp.]|nr:hypothetical protein [Rhodospirillum sp.]MCF8487879.1 hypothetical protein [Rhodospirillum sp.]MCF8499201.1 hypothetical protein [Rhodospirillum sp.]